MSTSKKSGKSATAPAPPKPAQQTEITVVDKYPPVVSVLVVAPHAWNKKEGKEKGTDYTEDDLDDFTGEIAQKVASILRCKALINWDWKKTTAPARNYNDRADAEKDNRFISELREAGRYEPFVLWIHGATDKAIIEEEKINNPKKPEDEEPLVHAVLGCGQKDNDNSVLTANQQIAKDFMAILREKGINTIPASPSTSPGRKTKCANQTENMCQWFRQNGFDIEKVPSVQIEIKRTGFRDSQANAENTGEILAKSVAELLGIENEVLVPDIAEETEPNETLVERAYTKVSEIVGKGFHNVMEEVGRYLIERFYGGDFKRADEGRPLKGQSFLQLINRIQENNDSKPSKTWLYNAKDLAVDIHRFRGSLPTYFELSHSQRVRLTNVRDVKEKVRLIQLAHDNNYTVAHLNREIGLINKKDPPLTLAKMPTVKELRKMRLKRLQKFEARAENEIKKLNKTIKEYEEKIKRLKSVIEEKAPKNEEGQN